MTYTDRGHSCAIVLAGGSGKRMETSVPKQFLELDGRPVLYYSLKCFQDCGFIRDIILVTGEDQQEYCRRQIVERYAFSKVRALVCGGKERYDSVYAGLNALKEDQPAWVFIHDSARPFIGQEMLDRGLEAVQKYGACSLGMPSKDTVSLTDASGTVMETPDRSRVWIVQTPQVFSYHTILAAHQKLRENGEMTGITDDVMVYRMATGMPVKMVQGSYRNIKITTPEDLVFLEHLMKPERSGRT